MSHLLKINGVEFTPIPGEMYRFDYASMLKDAKDGKFSERELYRHLFLNDLFFIVYFVMKVAPDANHPFVIHACKEVETGPQDYTLDVWAREHFKSTIITKAETLQFIGRNREAATLFLAHTKPFAKKILSSLMMTMENEGSFLNWLFPDVFYRDPKKEARLWNVDDGIIVNRDTARQEPTIYAGGLVEGMPTGFHDDRLVFDDIVTEDMAMSVETLDKVWLKFNSAQNLGKRGGHRRVVGTFYHNADPLTKIRDLKDPVTGEPIYYFRVKPATEDGTPNGRPVFLTEDELAKKRVEKTFYAQQLCDPTPEGTRKLPSSLIQDIEPDKIPTEGVIKLMAVDAAGDAKASTDGDPWCGMVAAIRPESDDFGALEVYITDLFLDRISEAEGPEIMGRMYMNNGYITMMGVEKVSQSTAEVHIANFVRQHKRILSAEARNLMLLRPAGRNKHRRIEQGLSRLLYNAKIHISTDIPRAFRERLRQEFDEFPFGKHDDGMDALTYIVSDMVMDKYVKAALMSAKQVAPKEDSYLKKLQGYGESRPGGSEWMRM